MIVEAVLDLLQAAFFALFSWLQVPQMPVEVTDGIAGFFELLQSGVSFIGFFLPARLILPFFAVFSAIFAVDHGYPFIMWIVRKIPVSIE